MYHIAICDDDFSMVEKIEKYIIEYRKSNDFAFNTYKFLDGESLASSDIKFNLVFLDIEMKGINGITTAELIRERNMELPIVYITSYSDYSMQAHRVHAFDYISKPFEYVDIERVLNDFKRIGKKSDVEVIELHTEDKTIMQRVDEIIYFSTNDKRKINMYTTENVIIVKGIMSDIYDKLDKDIFYMPHMSFIINLKYIENISEYYNIKMSNNDIVPLSQKRRKEFSSKLRKFSGE